ncbi:WxL domain-containing protein, partial [Enterococcus ureasiticus]|uniref:WxL domain-containing protein n=1 Tax=Enterococcus ureasiticus TaxID=903984 RepID=UPI001A8FE3AE
VSKDSTDVGIRFDTDGPVKPGPGPYKDNLALIWTPSRFDFGKQKATANIATFSNKVVGDQYLVVNDDRASEAEKTTSAWKLSATMSELVSKDSTKAELPAKLTFSLGDIESYDIGDVDEETNDYYPNPIEGNLGKLAEGSDTKLNKAVSLEAGNTTAVELMGKTKANAVVDGFATKLSDTKLVVTTGTGAEGKNFSGQVNWSLDNTY